MTAHDDERAVSDARLIAAMKSLAVFSRIDERGRILAFDGKQEYEVSLNLERIKTTGTGTRRVTVGESSLRQLESGDVTALFSHGVKRPESRIVPLTEKTPVSPHYGPLEWVSDTSTFDDADALAAESDDWSYQILPARGPDGVALGYCVSGSDYESGSELGSRLIDGTPGEWAIEEAKAAAQADYASRYCEAEQLLIGMLSGLRVNDGRQTCWTEQGRIFCQADQEGIDEVEVVATLKDFFDDYDSRNYRVTVCVRTILAGDGDGTVLLEQINHIIRQSDES